MSQPPIPVPFARLQGPRLETTRDEPGLAMRGVHIDLKQHAPRWDWLMAWLEQLAAWKINTLVLEYEDKFPYARAADIAHRTAWSAEQVRRFVARAESLGIQVVPLVQTLGHLEYVLVHDRYAELRERPDVLSQACPCNPRTFDLVTTMLAEVIALHPGSDFVHIGADEAAFLGRCPDCARRAADGGAVRLYAEYVGRVCDWVVSRGKRPVMWDDILRRELEQAQRLPRSTVLMYWDYGSTGERFAAGVPGGAAASPPPPYVRYREAGYDVVMASCFTGGGLVPDVTSLAANSRHLAAEAASHGCLGVVATNWACLFTPLSLSWHALAALADSAWDPQPAPRQHIVSRRPSVAADFDRRFCRAFLGRPDDTLVHALRLLDTTEMFAPGGEVYPTYVSEPMFVDPSFRMNRETYAALGAAFLRPDWPTPARDHGVPVCWQAKVAALRAAPDAERIANLVRQQLERGRHGLQLLEGAVAGVDLNRDFAEDLLAGAAARVWRLEQLLHELAGAPAPPPRPEARRALEAAYARALEAADAAELAGWMLTGLP